MRSIHRGARRAPHADDRAGAGERAADRGDLPRLGMRVAGRLCRGQAVRGRGAPDGRAARRSDVHGDCAQRQCAGSRARGRGGGGARRGARSAAGLRTPRVDPRDDLAAVGARLPGAVARRSGGGARCAGSARRDADHDGSGRSRPRHLPPGRDRGAGVARRAGAGGAARGADRAAWPGAGPALGAGRGGAKPRTDRRRARRPQRSRRIDRRGAGPARPRRSAVRARAHAAGARSAAPPRQAAGSGKRCADGGARSLRGDGSAALGGQGEGGAGSRGPQDRRVRRADRHGAHARRAGCRRTDEPRGGGARVRHGQDRRGEPHARVSQAGRALANGARARPARRGWTNRVFPLSRAGPRRLRCRGWPRPST